jgi:hypothetical protein
MAVCGELDCGVFFPTRYQAARNAFVGTTEVTLGVALKRRFPFTHGVYLLSFTNPADMS